MNKWWAGTPNYNGGNNGRLFLFPHWTAGGFDGSVSTLQNPNRQASAHYVIEGNNVAQLVDEDNTAWHCGNSWYNWRSISYELVGWPGNPPSRATLDTCAELMAEASCNYFGGAGLVLGENVMLHKMVSSTSCPGETDITYLVAKANEILGQGSAPSNPSSSGSSDIDDLARRTIAGEFGNGDQRRAALGSDFDAVQARVNEMLGFGGAPAAPSVDIDDLARRVINGEFGNGDSRQAALGSNYDAVQARVNEILGGGGSYGGGVDIEDLAQRTIAGEFGNGDARRAALGSNYDVVQARVNELFG